MRKLFLYQLFALVVCVMLVSCGKETSTTTEHYTHDLSIWLEDNDDGVENSNKALKDFVTAEVSKLAKEYGKSKDYQIVGDDSKQKLEAYKEAFLKECKAEEADDKLFAVVTAFKNMIATKDYGEEGYSVTAYLEVKRNVTKIYSPKHKYVMTYAPAVRVKDIQGGNVAAVTAAAGTYTLDLTKYLEGGIWSSAVVNSVKLYDANTKELVSGSFTTKDRVAFDLDAKTLTVKYVKNTIAAGSYYLLVNTTFNDGDGESDIADVVINLRK